MSRYVKFDRLTNAVAVIFVNRFIERSADKLPQKKTMRKLINDTNFVNKKIFKIDFKLNYNLKSLPRYSRLFCL